MKTSLSARRIVAALAALTTLHALSAGPCGHRDGADASGMAAGVAASRTVDGGDAGCHGSTRGAATSDVRSTHGEHPDDTGTPPCHCLGACCCAQGVEMATPVVTPVARAIAHAAPIVANPARAVPERGDRRLPPSTAPPAVLVIA